MIALRGGAQSRRRVVLLTTSYPAYPGDAAGRVVQVQAEELASQGCEVDVLAPGRVDGAKESRAGVRVHRLGAEELFAWPGALPRLVERPARALALPAWLVRARRTFERIASPAFSDRPIDALVAHWMVPSGFPLGFWLTRVLPSHRGNSGTPQNASHSTHATEPPVLEVIAHGSDVRLLTALSPLVRRAIVGALLARGARFRFVAHALFRELCESLPGELAERLQKHARVEPLDLALDPATLARAKSRGEALRSSLGSERPIWISCGRLVAGKGLDFALDRASREGARWLVVGDGPERQRLEKETRRRGMTAHFTGQLDHQEALAWIAAADRLLQFSRAEGAPSAVREARALGVRVLASATAGDVSAWASSDPGIEIV